MSLPRLPLQVARRLRLRRTGASRRKVACVVASFALGGCGETSTAVEAPMVPATAVSSSVALARGPEPKSMPAAASGDASLAAGDRLSGHYFCAQGRTDLTLVIEEVRGDEVFVVFDFSYKGRDAPAAGRFRMHGTLERRSRRLDLHADDWIDRPGRYVTVDLSGVLGSDTYKGSVKGPGCSTFHVTRTPMLPSR